MSDGDDDDRVPARLERVPSGVLGLDAILKGGFFRGGVYLVHAEPGSGKTVLGNQVCFWHVAAGGRAVVVTLLTESHTRLLAQLGSMTFFDPSVVGSSLSYVSGYQALEADHFKGLLVLVRKAVRDQKATLLLIDGVITASGLAESELETKRFIYELQAFAELSGCTTLLLTGASEPAEQYAFRTMVDGLIGLRLDAVGMEAVRTLEVTKFRGGPVLMGRHFFEITDAGVTVHPRAEARLGRSIDRPQGVAGHRAKFGIPGLDAMLGGGLRSGSVTMTIGTPGSGKTLAGLSFLAAGAREREPGAYFGFFETPDDLERKARAIGLSLAEHVESGLVDMMWQSPLDGVARARREDSRLDPRARRPPPVHRRAGRPPGVARPPRALAAVLHRALRRAARARRRDVALGRDDQPGRARAPGVGPHRHPRQRDRPQASGAPWAASQARLGGEDARRRQRPDGPRVLDRAQGLRGQRGEAGQETTAALIP
jgi:circadian clock protein KaiC